MTEIFRGFMLTAEVIMKPKVTINYVSIFFPRGCCFGIYLTAIHRPTIPDLDTRLPSPPPLVLLSTIFDNGVDITDKFCSRSRRGR